MGAVRVIGLGGRGPADDWEPLLAGRTLVARSSLFAARAIPPGWMIAHGYDDVFDQPGLTDALDYIVNDLQRRASDADVAYLVPGSGNIGDATAAKVSELIDAEVVPGALQAPVVAQLQIVDALTLAVAQEAGPFDAGSASLEPLVPAFVTNWYGTRVTSAAGERLRDLYNVDALPDPDHDGTLVVPARLATDAPPSVAALRRIYARLRQPNGCPWDREQTASSLLPALREEVEEFAEATAAGDGSHAAEELGDVIGNAVMIAQIEAERGAYQFEDAIGSIAAKLVRRHPHVFGDVSAGSTDEVMAIWSQVKQQEQQTRQHESAEGPDEP